MCATLFPHPIIITKNPHSILVLIHLLTSEAIHPSMNSMRKRAIRIVIHCSLFINHVLPMHLPGHKGRSYRYMRLNEARNCPAIHHIQDMAPYQDSLDKYNKNLANSDDYSKSKIDTNCTNNNFPCLTHNSLLSSTDSVPWAIENMKDLHP